MTSKQKTDPRPSIIEKSFDKSFGEQSVQCYSVKAGGYDKLRVYHMTVRPQIAYMYLSQLHVGALDFHLGDQTGTNFCLSCCVYFLPTFEF